MDCMWYFLALGKLSLGVLGTLWEFCVECKGKAPLSSPRKVGSHSVHEVPDICVVGGHHCVDATGED